MKHKAPLQRILALSLAGLFLLSATAMQAQNKPASGKKPATTASSKGKKPTPKPKPEATPLPENSNDCIFAIELLPDIAFGPTTAPKGAGRIQDVMRDKNNPNVFEYEHNSVWYKFTVPYNGDLTLQIVPTDPKDDYDFIVFRYTDAYFSNRIIEGKVKPLASCLSALDTAARSNIIGMSKEATRQHAGPATGERFVKSIPVRKGEVYYIALDNLTGHGGHTITAGISVESFEPRVTFYDPALKKNVEVDLLILEKNLDNRPVVKNPHFRGGKVKFVPGFTYTLYAKREGYFSVYKEFNSNIFKEDTILNFHMQQAVKGTRFSLSDIYFDDDAQLLPESHAALQNYIALFRNHAGIAFQVKGHVQSYGIDIERDQQLSLARAQAVKDYFAKNGVSPDRITVAGMTQNEIKRSAAAALNKGQAFRDVKCELIITSVTTGE